MNKLIAKKNNEVIEVIESDNEIKVLSDGQEDNILKDYLLLEGETLSIGGTYYPEKDSLLFFYVVLNELEYDVKIIGELEEIPYEDGLIY